MNAASGLGHAARPPGGGPSVEQVGAWYCSPGNAAIVCTMGGLKPESNSSDEQAARVIGEILAARDDSDLFYFASKMSLTVVELGHGKTTPD